MMLTWTLVAALRVLGFFFEPGLDAAAIHAVAGEPRRVEAVPTPETLTVVTWNIERGVHFERVAATLAEFKADVVLLQEVDRICDRSKRRDVARDLAVHLNMNWVSAGEFQEIGEGARGAACVTGQAILSRLPIEDATAIKFAAQASAKWKFNPAQPRRGGRIALRARIAGHVWYSLHLESGGNDQLRTRQVAELAKDAAAFADVPVMVAGDFNNTPPAKDALLTQMRSSGFGALPTAGPPARRPIDWMFLRAPRAGIQARIVPTAGASDHDPLVTSIPLATAGR